MYYYLATFILSLLILAVRIIKNFIKGLKLNSLQMINSNYVHEHFKKWKYIMKKYFNNNHQILKKTRFKLKIRNQ